MPEAQWDSLVYFDFPLGNDSARQAEAMDACVSEFTSHPLPADEQVRRAEALSNIAGAVRCCLGRPAIAKDTDVQAVLRSFDGAVEAGILYDRTERSKMVGPFWNICERALHIRQQLAGLRN